MDAIPFTERGILDQGADGAAGYFRQAAFDLFGFRPRLCENSKLVPNRGAKTISHMPIAALRASGGVGFSRGVLQSEFLHSLGPSLPLRITWSVPR